MFEKPAAQKAAVDPKEDDDEESAPAKAMPSSSPPPALAVAPPEAVALDPSGVKSDDEKAVAEKAAKDGFQFRLSS